MFGCALALRLAYLAELHGSLLFTTPLGDARAYLEWARAIAAGDWLGHDVFYQAPLYPYFLAAVLSLTGSELWAPRLVQALGGALACVLLGRAAERFFRPAVGLAAGIGLAVYGPAVYFDGLIQKPALDALLVSALLFALSGAVSPVGVGRAVAAGVLLGLLGLSRENALALAPVVAVWLATLPGPMAVGRRAAAVAALALGIALVLIPVGVRNAALGGRFLLTTAQLGPNLWIGNHPGASGRYEPLRPGRGSARFEREDARALAEAAEGRALSPAEVSDYWRDRALGFARENPAEWLRLLGYKGMLTWNARELPDTEGIQAYAQESWLLRALCWPFHFGVLAPLALVGMVAERRAWRRLWLLPALALALAASVAAFYVFARYRYPLVPVLMPLAAAGALGLHGAVRTRAWPALAPLAVAGLVAAVAVNWPLGRAESPGLTHYGTGAALLEAGRLAEAQTELERAVADLPGFAPAQSRLGDVLRKRGEPARALAAYERALALDPQLADAHAGRGIALEALGRASDAEAEYGRALALDPNHPDANNNLANQRMQGERYGEAVNLYQRARAARPDDPDIAANLGAALVRTGDFQGALAMFDAALALDPHHASAQYNRALTLAAFGRRDEARAGLQQLLAQQPPDSAWARRAREALAAL